MTPPTGLDLRSQTSCGSNGGGRKIYIETTRARGKNTDLLRSGLAVLARQASLPEDSTVEAVINCIRKEWGGDDPYISMGSNFNIAQRNKYICENPNGESTFELANKFNMTERNIYRIRKQAVTKKH